MKLRCAVLAVLVPLALAGCTGPLVAPTGPSAPAASSVVEARDVGDVTRIVLQTPGDLTIVLGAEPALTITAGSDVVDALTAVSNGDTLTLGADRDLVVGDPGIRYALTVTSLRAVTAEGSGGIVADFGDAPVTSIAVSGSGTVTAALASRSLDTTLNGSGSATTSGSTDAQTVSVAGSGRVDGRALASRSATVSVVGSGSARVDASSTLAATVSGSGTVVHSGGAAVTSSVSGSGSVTAG